MQASGSYERDKCVEESLAHREEWMAAQFVRPAAGSASPSKEEA